MNENQSALSKTHIMVVLALFCCALWGSAFPCVKIGFDWLNITTTGSKILFAGYRFFLAGVMTFIAGSILEKRILTVKKDAVLSCMGLGVVQTTMEYLFFYIGMSFVTGSKGAIVNGSSTFFSIILAHFLIKGERLTMKKIVGCIIGFAGVVLVNAGGFGGSFSFMGEGMVILSAAAYGAGSVITKMIAHKATPMALTSYQLMFGGLILIITGFMMDGQIGTFDLKSTVLMIYMALISFLGFSIWTALLKYNPVGKVAVFGFSIPVFGAALSAMALGENIFTFTNLSALICVCVGIIIVNLSETREN